MPFYLEMSKNITQQRDIYDTVKYIYIYIYIYMHHHFNKVLKSQKKIHITHLEAITPISKSSLLYVTGYLNLTQKSIDKFR